MNAHFASTVSSTRKNKTFGVEPPDEHIPVPVGTNSPEVWYDVPYQKHVYRPLYFSRMRKLLMEAPKIWYFTNRSQASDCGENIIFLSRTGLLRPFQSKLKYIWTKSIQTTGRGRVDQLLSKHALLIWPLSFSICGVSSNQKCILHR